jgi:hypothetical protein
MVAAWLNLHLDLADGEELGARLVVPFHDVTVGTTSDILDVDVTPGVVVAGLLAAGVDVGYGRGLGGRDLVRERHAMELLKSVRCSIMWTRAWFCTYHSG